MKATNPRKLLFKYFNYRPLFVPEPSRGVLVVLAEKGPQAMVAELERLASLGSAWASATLGYLSLLPSLDGVRDPERAEALCAKAAAQGDGYALFVLGWARFLRTRDAVAGGEAMLRSRLKLFAPAVLALSFFTGPKIETAVRFLDEAQRLGHKATWAMRCGFYRTGRLGVVRRILGYVLTPFARLQYFVAMWRDPFSEKTLFFSFVDPRPAFRSVKPNERDGFYDVSTKADGFELEYERTVFNRKLLVVAHCLIGFCAAFWYLNQIDLRHFHYWGRGSSLTAIMLAAPALVPYLGSAIYSYRVVTGHRLRVWIFLLVLVAGAVFVTLLRAGFWGVNIQGFEGVYEITVAQLGVYIWAAEWLLNVV